MRREDESLAAYVDGVAELDGAERQRVEDRLRDDAELRAEADATRGMLDQLRALPHEGVEPDWNKLEIAIRDAVGPDVPRRWWRNWRWLAPITAFATTATIADLWLHHPAPAAEPKMAAQPVKQVLPVAPAPAAPAAEPEAVYVDGQVVDVGNLDDADEVLDELDPAAHDAVADDGSLTVGILPAANLNWVDTLDDGAIDRAERWLARKKS